MPYKPRRGCAYGWCNRLAVDGERFCEEHLREENRRYERYQRDPATRKRYGRAWRTIRDNYVKSHPFCEECYKRGVLVDTQEVHHWLPLKDGGTHDEVNLVALCKSCHARIHAKRGDRWHN